MSGEESVSLKHTEHTQRKRAVANLTVPGGQDFHFPHSFLKCRRIFLIFPEIFLHYVNQIFSLEFFKARSPKTEKKKLHVSGMKFIG